MCEVNIYLCCRMLQSQEGKEDKESSNFCDHFFNQPQECSMRVTFLLLKSYAKKVKMLDQSQNYVHLTSLKIS